MSKNSESKSLIDNDTIESIGLATFVAGAFLMLILPMAVGMICFFLIYSLINELTEKHEKKFKIFYLCFFSVGITLVNSYLFCYILELLVPIISTQKRVKMEFIEKLMYFSFISSTALAIILSALTIFIKKFQFKKNARFKSICEKLGNNRQVFLVITLLYMSGLALSYNMGLYDLFSPILLRADSSKLWADLTIYPPSYITGINWLLIHTIVALLTLIFSSFYISSLISFIFNSGDSSNSKNNSLKKIAKEVKNNQGIMIGLLNHKPKNLLWSDINHHIHVLGQIGAGKSILLRNIYSHQIMSAQGLMMIDLKGEYELKDEFKTLYLNSKNKNGFNLFDVSNPSGSIKYNPLLRGNSTELKDKFMLAFTWSEEYYRKQAESFLLLVFNALVIVRDDLGELMTINDVLSLLVEPKNLLHLREKIPSHYKMERDDLEDLYIQIGKSKNGIHDLAGLKTDLELIVKSSLGPMVNSHQSVDLLDIIMKKQILLVSLDGQRFGETAKRISRLFISDLRSCSGYISNQVKPKDRPQFTLVIDEFADIVSSKESGEMFANLLNRSRSSGIGCVIAHQSLGDFEDERVMKQIIDNTGTLLTFVQKDNDSAEKISKMIGTKEVNKTTKQTKKELFMSRNTGSGSVRTTEEFHIHPNQIKNLNIGEAIYFTKKPTSFGKLEVRFLVNPSKILHESSENMQEFENNFTCSGSKFLAYSKIELSKEIKNKYFSKELTLEKNKLSNVTLKGSIHKNQVEI